MKENIYKIKINPTEKRTFDENKTQEKQWPRSGAKHFELTY